VEPLVRELEFEADYGQIYIYDPATQVPDQNAMAGTSFVIYCRTSAPDSIT
jgi:hypothetical protein